MSASEGSDYKWRRRHLCHKLICRNLSIQSYRILLMIFTFLHLLFFILTCVNNSGSDAGVIAVAIPMFAPVVTLFGLIVVQPIPERKNTIARVILLNLILFVAFIALDIYALVYFEGNHRYYTVLATLHIILQLLAFNLLYQYYVFISYHYDPATRDALLQIAMNQPNSDNSSSFNVMFGLAGSGRNSAGTANSVGATPAPSPNHSAYSKHDRPSSLTSSSSVGRTSLMIEEKSSV